MDMQTTPMASCIHLPPNGPRTGVERFCDISFPFSLGIIESDERPVTAPSLMQAFLIEPARVPREELYQKYGIHNAFNGYVTDTSRRF
ncbi:UNVERIFIED_ORG: hypothetical protein ABID33_000927 [Xanthobacter viscosus]|uniref:hypothetical protein n=1 Tax=Xanthobacter autotrophicus TaxID=280 RepID=UPI00147785BD|nr:hypothetical protein [Xanthobacter autotrophicus]